MAIPLLEFYVEGRPMTAGSKRAFPIRKGGVYVRSIVVDDTGAAGKSWRALVQDRAREAYAGQSDLLQCPLCLELEFNVARPKGHFGRGGVRPSAPWFPTTRPDLLKLARAIEDALTGVIWRDDAQIVTEILKKRYTARYGVRIRLSVPCHEPEP